MKYLKAFENLQENWTLSKIRKLFKLEDNNVVNPMDIFYNTENKKLYDNIVKYFNWKYNVDYCEISYFFNNEKAPLGVKVLDEYNEYHLDIFNHNENNELCKFLNNPELFIATNKYNL